MSASTSRIRMLNADEAHDNLTHSASWAEYYDSWGGFQRYVDWATVQDITYGLRSIYIQRYRRGRAEDTEVESALVEARAAVTRHQDAMAAAARTGDHDA